MKIDIKETSIPCCFQLFSAIFKDERGSFIKSFHEEVFTQHKLETDFAEEYYSFSRQGVLRGLHFQLPPKDHVKLVYCVSGEVLDAVVDLRVGSPTYRKFELFNLSAEKGNMLYIPKGLAHGFYVLSKNAIMMYKVTTVYSSEHDTGIRWDSAGIPWPSTNPILSERDNRFSTMNHFESPFIFKRA